MLRIKLFGLDIYGCVEALERLDDYVDRELSPEEAGKVQQHLKLCHHCARKFGFEQELLTGLRGKAQNIPFPGDVNAFQAKISAMLQREASADSTPPPSSTEHASQTPSSPS